jgi:hypothetical protein
LKSLTPLLAAAIAALATSAALAKTPVAHAATSCSVGSGEHVYGYFYIYPIKVTNTNCATGKNVAKHHGHLRGWHCNQKTLANSATERIAQESCTSGRKKVVYKFTQNK